MIEHLFNHTLYVKIAKNKLELRKIETRKNIMIYPKKPFTTKRLLVGQFTEAEAALTEGMKKIQEGKWFPIKPTVIIQPVEMIEEGLSQVEEKALLELAKASGARKVFIWIGQELSDAEVIKKSKSA